MSETNVEIVKNIYQRGGAGDFEGMAALVDPNIVVHEAASLPYGGVYHGIAAMGELMKTVGSFVDGFSIEPKQYFVSGDDVAALIRVVGRSRATGEAIDMQVMEVWTVKNGLATVIRPFYWDTAEFSRLTNGSAK